MIYLDHNATTPVTPEVRDAMLPYFTEEWGNPSSSYRFGSKLKTVIEKAREQVAELLGANPREILFTSCATESNNAAIHAALKADPKKRHVITSAVEHSSVLTNCRTLETEGVRVTYLPVDRDGLLKMADLEAAIADDIAPAGFWIAEFKKRFAKIEQVLHSLIAAFKKSFACFVTVNNRASPATKTRVSARRCAGVNLDCTLTAASLRVKFVKRTIVTAPRTRMLEQISPHFFGRQKLDRV
ncbi:MAG: aminotransferase class V-fold PLP-dependent enzyme [Verrucomicrobiota bacterium]|jgi:hypothetical protein